MNDVIKFCVESIERVTSVKTKIDGNSYMTLSAKASEKKMLDEKINAYKDVIMFVKGN